MSTLYYYCITKKATGFNYDFGIYYVIYNLR